jgi:hypothetical protein
MIWPTVSSAIEANRANDELGGDINPAVIAIEAPSNSHAIP